MRKRVATFIDGFNIYHAIDNLKEPSFKWLDLFKLSQEFVHPHQEVLTDVHYFSTLAKHRNSSAILRQKDYLRALEFRGVKTVLGNFKEKTRDCRICKGNYSFCISR